MRLYWRYLSIHLRSQMQYRGSFFMLLLGQFLGSFSAFAGMYFLFSRFHQVEGFRLPEVMLCFSVVLTAFSLSECFARGFDRFPTMLGNGTFDRVLLRPRSPVFQVLGQQMDFSRLGKLLQAVLMLAYAVPFSGVVWTPGKMALLGFMIRRHGGVFGAVYDLRSGQLLYHRGTRVHEYIHRRRTGIRCVSVCNLRKRGFAPVDIRGAAGDVPVLPAAGFVRTYAAARVRPDAGSVPGVLGPLLRSLADRAAPL